MCIFLLLRNILEEFVLELEIQNYSRKTIITYKSKNLNFIKYLENKHKITKIEDVKTLHVKSYVAWLKQAQRKPTYINSVIKSLQVFYKYSKEENFTQSSPITDVKLLKVNQPLARK